MLMLHSTAPSGHAVVSARAQPALPRPRARSAGKKEDVRPPAVARPACRPVPDWQSDGVQRLAWTPGRAIGHLPAWAYKLDKASCSSSAICGVLRARGDNHFGRVKKIGIDGDLN